MTTSAPKMRTVCMLTGDKAPEKWHGTAGGYANHKCRCDDCRRANAENHRRSRDKRRRIGPPPDHVHGTENGYVYYGCRCQPCKDAHSAQRREYEAQKRQKFTDELERLREENRALKAELEDLRGTYADAIAKGCEK